MSKKVPPIRFKGFTDAWEQRKLSNVLDPVDGIRRGPFGSALKKEFFVSNSDFTVYEQQNAIYDRYDTRYNITKEKFDELHRFSISPGDFIMSGAGTIGRISLVPEGVKTGIINQALIRMRINQENTDSTFFLQWMRSDDMQQKLTQANPGSAMVNLVPMSEVKGWDILIPIKEEQERIGSFFNNLDNLITLHQRELDLLIESKTGFLQKMFPKEGELVPELRFGGFNDNWILMKLVEVANYRNGKAHENNISDEGKYIVINSKFVSTNGKVKKYTNKALEPLLRGELAFVLSDVPNGKAIARTFLVDEDNKYSLNQRIAGITPLNNTHSYFLNELMNRNDYFLKFDNGVGQTNLSKSEVERFLAYYPSRTEQKLIGDFFKNLDDLIELNQIKLDNLKKLKKGFLQKMFV